MTLFTSSWFALLSVLVMVAMPCVAQPPLLKTTTPQDPHANDGVSFRVLCYHDVRDELRSTFKTWPESAALDTRDLIEHFEWLKANGFQAVTLDAILTARSGGEKLPPKALLLTFDDGYLSTYTRVFPLLKLFGYPAVIGLVGEWMEADANGKVLYGDQWMSRDHFVTWAQVREMTASGLVEVASHSHSLHKGAISNPQGSMPSSAITRIYDPAEKRYESDAQYVARIRNDLAKNSALIERHTGRKPRAMIWPYGAYNMLGVAAAQAEGMPITMNLDPGVNTLDLPLSRIRRDILFFNDTVGDLKRNLNQRAEYDGVEQPLDRIVTVDLDTIYDADPARQEDKLGALIERILRLRVNTVYLRAVADADGDGLAEAAYFPNRHLPVRVDLFNRVAWQLRARAAVPPDVVNVYAWLPVLAYKLPPDHSAVATSMETILPASNAKASRLSPFSAEARKTITEIYEDIGYNAPRVSGVVFGADATLGDLEDVSEPALRVYREEWQLPSTVAAISADAPTRDTWRRRKTEYLNQFTLALAGAFKLGQPNAMTARMIAPAAVLNPQAGPQLAQSYGDALKTYDFVVVSMASATWHDKDTGLKALVNAVARVPGALNTTAFLLPSFANLQPIPTPRIAAQLRYLQQLGARNFGYDPDNGYLDHPALAAIRPAISLKSNPGRRP